jgi:hypothetical protein
MRPFPHPDGTKPHRPPTPSLIRRRWPFVVLLAATAGNTGCVGVTGTTHTPPPPPPPVTVSVSPISTAVLLGNSQLFVATVTNTANTTVSWSVNGIPGGTAALGTITAAGLYSAPVDLPPALPIQITAVSQADSTKSANASVTVTSDVTLALTPDTAAAELGAAQAFHASIQSNGHPDPTLRWSVSGPSCPSNCGAVDSSGNFIAPQILPSPAAVIVTAQSVADPSKQVSATVAITSHFLLQLSAPASVSTGASAVIAATLTAVPGSNPSSALSWSLSGSGCGGATCGVLSVVTSQSAGGTPVANSATYAAPSNIPNPNTVTITVTPQADPSKRAQATLNIVPVGGSVTVSPPTATLAGNHRVTLTALTSGLASPAVAWSVNGIAGGNTALGQICVVATNPCLPVTSGSAAQVDYLAPGVTPSPDPVTVQATSAADPTKSAAAQITVINHVIVTVLPGSVTLAPLAVQRFAATVIGTSNQSVVWQVQGSACAQAGVCGSIDQTGAYTAPDAAPSPDSVQIVAVSSDDTSQSGSANVIISTGLSILTLHPASVYAGAADGFVLRVDGSGFTAGGAGTGSVVLMGGTPRTTACSSTTECTAPVSAADVATAGSVTVQMRNPDGTRSNAVTLIAASPNLSDEVIALTGATPSATDKDIVVVDPSTAGVSVPGDDVDLNIAALGGFSVSNNSCALGGNPVELTRPANGVATAEVCVFSESGLDAGMTYTVSGPGDVTVIARQPVGLGIIHLTLQIPSSALPGARTLFIQNANLDKTAASGALEIQ